MPKLLLYPKEHFVCFNYKKGQNANFEVLKRQKGAIVDRNLISAEIIFVIGGRFRVSFGGIVKQEIARGKILFFPPGTHLVSEIQEEVHLVICRIRDVVKLCECMSLERLYKEVEPLPEDFYMLEINSRIYNFIDNFVACQNDGLRCSYYFDTKMKELFFLLRAYYTKRQLAGLFQPMLSKDARFMNLMYKSYRSVKSVQELANISNYSLSGFKKQFRRIFGTSASKWMSEQKAKHVFQDLNNSPLSIKEIADAYDFSSVSAFNAFCIQKFGMPPGRVRLNIEDIASSI